MNIAVVGLSHKTAPVEIREKLSVAEDAREAVTTQVCHQAHIEEAAILSTCNRLEIYIVTSEIENGIREVTQFLAERSRIPLSQLRHHLFYPAAPGCRDASDAGGGRAR